MALGVDESGDAADVPIGALEFGRLTTNDPLFSSEGAELVTGLGAGLPITLKPFLGVGSAVFWLDEGRSFKVKRMGQAMPQPVSVPLAPPAASPPAKGTGSSGPTSQKTAEPTPKKGFRVIGRPAPRHRLTHPFHFERPSFVAR
jgi:hypothetical protein